jgi:hypothetical protein
MLRHNRIPFGTPSISFKIDAPVVVYPEIVSKIADGTDGIVPLNRNGSAPVIPRIIQPKVTIK